MEQNIFRNEAYRLHYRYKETFHNPKKPKVLQQSRELEIFAYVSFLHRTSVYQLPIGTK